MPTFFSEMIKKFLAIPKTVLQLRLNELLHYIFFGKSEKLQKLNKRVPKSNKHTGSFRIKNNPSSNRIKNMHQVINWSYSVNEAEILNRVTHYKAQKHKRQAKVVCYTSIDSADDDLIIPEIIVNEWDYVVFTNRTIEGEHIFDVRKPAFNHNNPLLTARYLKTHPHILFPQYEYSIWLDPYVMLKDKCLLDHLHRSMHKNMLIMLTPHPRHRTMQQRLESSLQSKHDKHGRIADQIMRYYDEGLPGSAVFYDSGILVRYNLNTAINKANEAWWNEIINGVKGDQLSLPYIIWKCRLSVELIRVKNNTENQNGTCYYFFANASYNRKNARPYKRPSFYWVSAAANNSPLNKTRLNPALKNKEANKLAELKIKLYRFGFVESAIRELKDIVEKSHYQRSRQKAASELAVWYADRKTIDAANKCLKYLWIAQSENTSQSVKTTAILEAESYNTLGKIKEAKKVLSEAIKSDPSADLLLAMASLSISAEQKLYWLNKVYDLYNVSHVALLQDKSSTDFERLDACISADKQQAGGKTTNATVTIIVSAYNAQATIHKALNSIINQTWKNLEIIVVDDCSNDNTFSIIKGFAKEDSRIKIIRLKQNQGTYVARNHALRIAKGKFVTCHDADDWSHPEKVTIQVRHLQQNKSIIANTSEFIRVSIDLSPFKKANSAKFVKNNYSSVMFRRKEVMEALGYWDSVRFSADSEMVFRIKKYFGTDSIVHLETGPLMLALQTDKTLTGNEKFGIHGFLNGARADYQDSFLDYMESDGDLFYPFPMAKRKFAVPEPLKPNHESGQGARRHFDTVIAFDFRLEGEIINSIIREVANGSCKVGKIGLVHLCIYEVSVKEYPRINRRIRQLINNKEVQLIVYGEQVACNHLVIKHPAILMEHQLLVPEIEVNDLIVETCNTTNQITGQTHFGYNKKICENNLHRYFHKAGRWICDKSQEND